MKSRSKYHGSAKFYFFALTPVADLATSDQELCIEKPAERCVLDGSCMDEGMLAFVLKPGRLMGRIDSLLGMNCPTKALTIL